MINVSNCVTTMCAVSATREKNVHNFTLYKNKVRKV